MTVTVCIAVVPSNIMVISIIYTGNHRDHHWNRVSSQMIARLKEDGTVEIS